MAAEKIAPLANINDVKQVRIELYKKAFQFSGTGAHQLNPDSRATADHSTPYVVAATLIDGTISARSFSESRLWDPALRTLLAKTEVSENPEFTDAYERLPQEHHARVTVPFNNGQTLAGKSGGGSEDQAAPKSDAQITDKFRSLTEDVLGAKRVSNVLGRLWHLDEMKDVGEIPRLLVIA